MGEAWRVVLATGEVREVVVTADEVPGRRTLWVSSYGTLESCLFYSPEEAIWSQGAMVDALRARGLDVRDALAPGEPTRAELAAQLAAVTAERDAALEECSTLRRGIDHADGVIDHTREALGAAFGEGAVVAAMRVARDLAVLRAQQAPLVACVDALRAAATAAGWRDADATGETLVAWVRRGGAREGAEAVFAAALRTEGVEARERIRQVAALRGLGWLSVDADECGDEDSACAAQSIAAKIRGREGGE